jgi:thiol-disulfide isomerase/thioredoxin
MTNRRRYAGPLVSALLAAVVVGGLAGCSSDPNSIAEQAKKGDQKGYVSGDGAVEQIPVEKRGAPVSLSGATIDGKTFDLGKDAASKIVVINVWGSWCAPCVAEAPGLQQVWSATEKANKPVQFLGINAREGAAAGAAFARKVGLTFPSLSDESGVQILNLQGKAPTTPTTLLLDKEHRIAARVNGSVSATILSGLIDDTLAAS